MASFNRAIITNKGMALIAKSLINTDIKFTKIRTSEKDYSTVRDLENIISIENVKQTELVSETNVLNNSTVQVIAPFTNTLLTTGYYLRTIGLYANDPDEGEILYSITTAIMYDWIPPFSSISVTSFEVKLSTVISNSNNLDLTINPEAVVNISQFNKFKEQVVSQLSESVQLMNSKEINVKFPPSELIGIKGGGIINDTVALQAIVNYANDGDTLVFPSDSYRLDNISINNKTLHIKGNGVTFIQNTNNMIFTVTGGWDFIEDISSIIMNTVTLSNAHTFNSGDILKIVSDDQLYGADTGVMQGEFVIVKIASTGTIVTLTNIPRLNYTTNPRVAKLKNKSFSIIGDIKFTADKTLGETNWNGTFVKLVALKDVKIKDVSCDYGYGAFFILQSLYGYTVDGITAKNLKNEPSLFRYGYGINDKASDGGKVINCNFINCRHGYTTNGDSVSVSSSAIEKYGETQNCNIDNCHAFSCSNSGFDTHPEGYNITFNNCISIGDYIGLEESTGAGFQLRGKKITLNNCTAFLNVNGFKIEGNLVYDKDNVKLINCKTLSLSNLPLIINNGVTIDGGEFNAKSAFLAQITNAKCEFKNCKLNYYGSGDYKYPIDIATDSTVELNNVVFDFANMTATHVRVFRIKTLNTILRINGVKGINIPESDNIDKFILNDGGATNIFTNNIELDKYIGYTSFLTTKRQTTGIPSIAPVFIGEEVYDSVNKNWYKSVGASKSDWKQITS